MLPPNELKNKEFSKAVRGYNPEEVDEHINFIIEKYSELYRENDELERRLKLTQAKLDALRRDEESIRTALINAQKAGATIINEANERAEVIQRAAKTNCDHILAEFRANIRIERENALKLRDITAKFKRELLLTYSEHIEYIEGIKTEIEGIDEINITDDALIRAAMSAIRGDVEKNADRLAEQAEAEEKRRVEAEEKRRAEEEAKKKAESEAAAKALAEAKAKEESEAKLRAETEARIRAEIEAEFKAEADLKEKAEASAKANKITDPQVKPANITKPAPVIAEKAVNSVAAVAPAFKDTFEETISADTPAAKAEEKTLIDEELEAEFNEEEIDTEDSDGGDAYEEAEEIEEEETEETEEADEPEETEEAEEQADKSEDDDYYEDDEEEADDDNIKVKSRRVNKNLPPRINPKPGSVKDQIVKLARELGTEAAEESGYADDDETELQYDDEADEELNSPSDLQSEDDNDESFGAEEFENFKPDSDSSEIIEDDDDKFAGFEEVPLSKPVKPAHGDNDDEEFDSLIKKMEDQSKGKAKKDDRGGKFKPSKK